MWEATKFTKIRLSKLKKHIEKNNHSDFLRNLISFSCVLCIFGIFKYLRQIFLYFYHLLKSLLQLPKT